MNKLIAITIREYLNENNTNDEQISKLVDDLMNDLVQML